MYIIYLSAEHNGNNQNIYFFSFRPDWQDRGPLTDSERIDDEINRQVALCTCKQKFKVFQVGEGKYRVSWISNLFVTNLIFIRNLLIAISRS